MIKRIPLETLKPGMFVSSFDLSWFKHPYVSTRLGVVRDQGLIDELRRLGVTHVEIDTSKSASPQPPQASTPASEPAGPSRSVPFPLARDRESTARFARKLFDQAMTVTKALMRGVSQGQEVDVRELQPLIAKLIESVNCNENILHIIFSMRAYDDYTYTHSLNLAALGVLLGQSMDVAPAELEQLGLAGILHDIGKCLIPREIIAKPAPLTAAEFEEIKRHPGLGFAHLRKQGDIPEHVLRTVLEHHERQDGTGYPCGLAGGDIHPFSSIISVVDVYDALTSDRIYRTRMSPHQALRTLFNLRGQAFPEDVVDRFIKRLGVYPALSVVQLKNGCYGMVTRQTPDKPLFPEVLVFCDRELRPVFQRRVDTWRLCGELARKEFEIDRPVEPDEMLPPRSVEI